MSSLYHAIFTSAAIDELFCADAQLRGMLAVEKALATAEASLGLVPAAAAATIGTVCDEPDWDCAALSRQTLLAGNPAIPLVKELTRRVVRRDQEAANYVHLGATSQDVLDTTLMLQVRPALHFIDQQLHTLQGHLTALTTTHRDTPMVGRTLLQQARPITFGYKVAGWLDALGRARQRLHNWQETSLVVQLGGAAGTLATLGSHGTAVASQLAYLLNLKAPLLPWHAQRDRLADLAAALGIVAGNLGKMAHDVLLLMQSEVGEVAEGAAPGKGGSSAMPHKRNPVATTFILAIAARVPALVATQFAALGQHEQERAAGAWHAEWETLPELLRLVAAALDHANDLLAGLEVYPEQMRHNLELTGGLIFAEDVAAALTPLLGKIAAQQLVETASKAAPQLGQHLKDYLQQQSQVSQHLTAAQLTDLFDPRRATGLSRQLTDAVLACYATPRANS